MNIDKIRADIASLSATRNTAAARTLSAVMDKVLAAPDEDTAKAAAMLWIALGTAFGGYYPEDADERQNADELRHLALEAITGRPTRRDDWLLDGMDDDEDDWDDDEDDWEDDDL